MHLRFQRRGAAGVALLFSIVSLQADITLPTAPPPQADAQAARVWRGDRTTIPLRGHHRGSGTVAFWIVDRPQHGTLSDLRLLGDNRATIVYQHDGAESAPTDRFSYLVKASGDQVSSPAEVRIFVEEPPAQLQIPVRIDFDEIMAGESETRQLTITNEGGGVLEGRLTVSAPWELGLSDYRVASGKTERIAVVFRPDEGRAFVGQITLSSSDGAERNVVLEGSATAPITFEPSQLRIELPKKENEPRAASVSLTNQTNRLLKLKFAPGASIQPIADVTLPPLKKMEISVVLSPGQTAPVDEAIVVSGNGFSERLPVEADALPPKQSGSSPHPTAMASAASPALSATTTLPVPTQQNIVRQEATTPPVAAPTARSLLPVRAQRLEAARWELRWARPKEPVAKYQVEERLLSVDGAGELQTTWRSLASSDVAETGNSVAAQIKGLDPRQVHLLRVTAFGAEGAALWESPLIALSPPVETSHRARGWALIFGIALVVLIVLHWRANRPLP